MTEPANEVHHRQYDEAPSRFFTLTFPDIADPVAWPALNATDKVTLLVRQKSGSGSGADIAVPLVITNAAGREVRWDPSGTVIAVAGEHDFVIRVTETNGRSYTHPKTGLWKLKMDRTAPDTDLADPA